MRAVRVMICGESKNRGIIVAATKTAHSLQESRSR